MADSRTVTGRIIGIVFIVLLIVLGFTFVESCHTTSDVREDGMSTVVTPQSLEPVS